MKKQNVIFVFFLWASSTVVAAELDITNDEELYSVYPGESASFIAIKDRYTENNYSIFEYSNYGDSLKKLNWSIKENYIDSSFRLIDSFRDNNNIYIVGEAHGGVEVVVLEDGKLEDRFVVDLKNMSGEWTGYRRVLPNRVLFFGTVDSETGNEHLVVELNLETEKTHQLALVTGDKLLLYDVATRKDGFVVLLNPNDTDDIDSDVSKLVILDSVFNTELEIDLSFKSSKISVYDNTIFLLDSDSKASFILGRGKCLFAIYSESPQELYCTSKSNIFQYSIGDDAIVGEFTLMEDGSLIQNVYFHSISLGGGKKVLKSSTVIEGQFSITTNPFILRAKNGDKQYIRRVVTMTKVGDKYSSKAKILITPISFQNQ